MAARVVVASGAAGVKVAPLGGRSGADGLRPPRRMQLGACAPRERWGGSAATRARRGSQAALFFLLPAPSWDAPVGDVASPAGGARHFHFAWDLLLVHAISISHASSSPHCDPALRRYDCWSQREGRRWRPPVAAQARRRSKEGHRAPALDVTQLSATTARCCSPPMHLPKAAAGDTSSFSSDWRRSAMGGGQGTSVVFPAAAAATWRCFSLSFPGDFIEDSWRRQYPIPQQRSNSGRPPQQIHKGFLPTRRATMADTTILQRMWPSPTFLPGEEA
ncbi:hypothetical protein C2845_PMPSC017835 [Panicum miliaceum]|uniref:Uncharacterized protein n=1 Tax=Panicum miliaceum TaxID=4540 RepID=A0A3L6P9A8_PANMI|nr:hypothetical protein C2845_PMPSC017835 [Panicum miliaceum]